MNNSSNNLSSLKSRTKSFAEIKLSKKSRINLFLRVAIISFCCIFFPTEAIIDSRLQEIELETFYTGKNNFLFASKPYQRLVKIITEILGSNSSLFVVISIIYIYIHPFTGLKLILVPNVSQYLIIFLQIIYQARRPSWDSEDEDTICRTTYANPSLPLFYSSFFYLYVLICFKMLKKKRFSIGNKIIINSVYIFILALLYFLHITSFSHYHHQIVYTFIISIVMLVVLIDYDTKIHNFIFHFLKNQYNTRVYKLKIFYFITGLFLLGYVGLFFMEEQEKDEIKNNLRKNGDCSETDIQIFGIRQCIINISASFGIIGAFWGAALTVEKKVGKWWGGKSKKQKIIKIICTLVVCGIFTGIIYSLDFLKNSFELYFTLKTLFYFLESYFIFGLLPLFFQYKNLNEAYTEESYEKIKVNLINEKGVQYFRNSIFNQEKKDKIDNINKNKTNNIKIKEIKEEKEQKNIENIINIKNEEDIMNNKNEIDKFKKRYYSVGDYKAKSFKRKFEQTTLIIENLVEKDEDEGDEEFFDLDSNKVNKSYASIEKLKEDLINNDDDNINNYDE
jgi:hypothetical protein